MSVSLCIHGHFYQPPREDPWLGRILVEASAAPMRHWNQRILRESYAPLAWARRLDSEGRIADILNCYEWISFNVGPTLRQWMQRSAPQVLERMYEGDRISVARWGHGNAMAQIYHHTIMPLASARDKELETRWAVVDFQRYFGRTPEGIWLSECAVDRATLEVLAQEGISFVILAPGQAKALMQDGKAVSLAEGHFSIGRPYQVALSQGKSMTVVFYHGELSQRIAFDGLLRDGELFWQRIADSSRSLAWENAKRSILTLATDGETYGHHFKFGEMALAHILAQGFLQRDGISLTNLATFIAENPPEQEVILHEPSAWSCSHGVERWQSDCGCKDGGHPDWNQKWRGPLREALQYCRDGVNAHFAKRGELCFVNADNALTAYGELLADAQQRTHFAAMHIKAEADVAWKLLAMQEQSLASFASCAWFFDDIARIEPENSLTYALRAMELMCETGGDELRPAFLAILAKAQSNKQGAGSGKDVFEKEVLSRRDSSATLCLLALSMLHAERRLTGAVSEIAQSTPLCIEWPYVSVEIFLEAGKVPLPAHETAVQCTVVPQGIAADQTDSILPVSLRGMAIIRSGREVQGMTVQWEWKTAESCVQEKTCATYGCSEVTTRLPNGTQERASLCGLSLPLRDFLLDALLERKARGMGGDAEIAARYILSLLNVWEEAQHGVCRPEFWVSALPYTVPLAMKSAILTNSNREQLRVILEMHLNTAGKKLAQKLVEEEVLLGLHRCTPLGKEEATNRCVLADDATLAVWVERVTQLLPDMDWWNVQNTVWELGVGKLPETAKRLRFV